MKKSILVLALAAIGMMSFSSCSESAEQVSEGQVEKEYYCPMKCEGDKMYVEEGSCPVCEMDLVKD
ncbi:MAG: heavy metal-binding domain-containing protein [Crocinitomicaceae bacterium]|nr:heavy metal-binding domain-containing protein [Crocinitomicaceae bacterium]